MPTNDSVKNSIMKGRGFPTEERVREGSTVGVELSDCQLGDTVVQMYDCGGQPDYGSMQQTFMTRRALYLLVWDVQECRAFGSDKIHEVT